MERRFIWVGIIILVVLAIAIGSAYLLRDVSYRGVRYNPGMVAYDFQLESGNGAQVSLHDYRGKLVLLFFGFTNCTDICPTTLAILNEVDSELGKKAARIQVVYVTVDPQRDSPQHIQDYVSRFNPNFVGLSGNMDQMEKVWEAYGITRQISPSADLSGDYEVTHSTRLFVIDPQGRLFLSYAYGTPRADIVHDIQLLLGNE